MRPELASAIALIILTLTAYSTFLATSIAICSYKLTRGRDRMEHPVSINLNEKYYKLFTSSDKFTVASSSSTS